MNAKAPDRGLFETLTVALLVAGLVLATMLMLAIAWRMRTHARTSSELEGRLRTLREAQATTLDLLGRYEASAQKLETDIAAEERRRAQLAEEARQAAILRAQEEAKARAEEEAARRNTPAELMRQAEALIRERRFPDAYQRLTAVIQAEPDNARAFANRALALVQLRRPQEALSDLDRAAMLDPRDGYVFQTRAGLLLELNRSERAADALADCDRALQLGKEGGGNEAYLHYYRANALKALDRKEEARQEYQWVHDNVPGLRRIVADVLRAMDLKQKEGQAPAPPPPGK